MVFGLKMSSGVCAWVQTISGSAARFNRQPVAMHSISRAAFSPVAASANQRCIGTANDAVQSSVIGAVEKIFHHAGHRREVFRCREDVTIGVQHFGRSGLRRAHEPRFDF